MAVAASPCTIPQPADFSTHSAAGQFLSSVGSAIYLNHTR
jgi:hypothetical protein